VATATAGGAAVTRASSGAAARPVSTQQQWRPGCATHHPDVRVVIQNVADDLELLLQVVLPHVPKLDLDAHVGPDDLRIILLFLSRHCAALEGTQNLPRRGGHLLCANSGGTEMMKGRPAGERSTGRALSQGFLLVW
jgi:hypothetical protein